MGSGEDSAGLFFTAFMFIGMGVGYMLGNTAGGLFVGMGIGFLVMAYIKMKRKSESRVPSGEAALDSFSGGKIWGPLALTVVGIGFILGGLSFLLGIEVPWEKIGGVFLLLLGLAFLGMALKR